MRKRLLIFLSCLMLASTSLVAYAACVTHVVPSGDQGLEFISVVNARSGGTHPYAKVVTQDGTVLQWGTCQDTIFTDRYGKRCLNCHEYVEYTTKERTEHNPQ